MCVDVNEREEKTRQVVRSRLLSRNIQRQHIDITNIHQNAPIRGAQVVARPDGMVKSLPCEFLNRESGADDELFMAARWFMSAAPLDEMIFMEPHGQGRGRLRSRQESRKHGPTLRLQRRATAIRRVACKIEQEARKARTSIQVLNRRRALTIHHTAN